MRTIIEILHKFLIIAELLYKEYVKEQRNRELKEVMKDADEEWRKRSGGNSNSDNGNSD